MDGNGLRPGVEAVEVGELLKRLSDQTRHLAQQELELAKVELATKAKAAAVGGGLLGAAGLFGLLALLTLTAALVLALATVLAGWLAASIVAVVYLVAASALALAGRAHIVKATPLAPTQALASVKEDVAWLKTQARYART